VKFSITFRTSVNAVRDKESQLIKNNLKAIGINVDLRPVDSGVFFGLPDNPDNLARFETDLEMYTNGASFPDVQSLQATYTSDQIAQKSNGWKGTQVMRWTNAEYNQTIKEMTTTLDPAKRLDLFKKADSILMGDYAVIPLVARAGLACYTKGLTGVNLTSWDSDLWNTAHWTKP
jgi:peptide/nickel transport system substrate-binding protein